MDEQLTIRLPRELRVALERAARRTHRKSAEIVRMALQQYLLVGNGAEATRADRVADLIGSVDSGVPDLAERHREYVLESIRRGA